MEDSSPHLQPAPAAKLKKFETLKCNEQNHFNYNSLHLKEQLNLSIFITVISTDSKQGNLFHYLGSILIPSIAIKAAVSKEITILAANVGLFS